MIIPGDNASALGPTNLSPLPPKDGGADEDLLPLRMLNEYAYCPRLFHLMQIQGRWADIAFTVEGRNVHRRADNHWQDQVLILDLGPAERDLPTMVRCIGKAYQPHARVLVV